MLPQLWGGSYALPIVEARMSLLRFLTSVQKEEVEIVTDAPQYDWELFATWYMRADDGPESFVISDATTLSPTSEGEELPHHALLDARIIAGMFASVSRGNPDGAWAG